MIAKLLHFTGFKLSHLPFLTETIIGGRNPISLWNVLFVGNLCALILLIVIYGRQWNRATLKQLSTKDWVSLRAVAILSGAIASGLIFQALALTNVNNVIFSMGLGDHPRLSLFFKRELLIFLE